MYKVVLFCVIAHALSAHLPSEFTTCRRSDPNFEECLKSSVGDAIQKLANGNKKFHVPALDPYVIPQLEIKKQPGPVSLNQKFTDVTFTGFSKNKITGFKIDLDKCNIRMEILTPHLDVRAKYEFEGNFITIPVKAKGDFHNWADNFKTVTTMTCEKFKQNGVEHLRINNASVTDTMENMKIELGDLFEGNSEINEQLNQLIQSDPYALMDVIQPTAQELWAQIISNLANNFFTTVPLNEIFKE